MKEKIAFGFAGGRLVIAAMIAIIAPLGCSTSSGPKRPDARPSDEPWAPPVRMASPEYLPPAAREMLRQRMARHGPDMMHLVWASVLLDHERAGEMAGRIADDANFARPISHDATELNSLIPPKFYDLQDDLRRRARELALVASQGDTAGVSRAYGALAETCVNCHAVYRDGSGR